MSKILFLVYGALFSKEGYSEGTRIRVFELARAMKKAGHKVTVGQTNEIERMVSSEPNKRLLKGMNLIRVDRSLVKKGLQDFDIIISYPNPLLTVLLSRKSLKQRIVVDLYDPLLVSDSMLHSSEHGKQENKTRFLQALYLADLIICANQRQKDLYMGMLTALCPTQDFSGRIIALPFGIQKDILEHDAGSSIRQYLPENKKNSRIILWPGTMYPWFDPITAVYAFEKLAKKKGFDDVVMVFAGATHFQLKESENLLLRKVKALCAKKGLLGQRIFFAPWTPYDKRASLYKETELAVISYHDSLENYLSWRSRVIDCLAGGVAVICTKGNLLAESIEHEGLGKIVEPEDVDELAEKMVELLSNKKKTATIRGNINKFRSRLEWRRLAKPLDDFCRKKKKSKNVRIRKKGKNVLSGSVLEEMQVVIDDFKLRNEELQDLSILNENKIRNAKKDLMAKEKQFIEAMVGKDQEIRQKNNEILRKNNKIMEKELELKQKDEDLARQKKTYDGIISSLEEQMRNDSMSHELVVKQKDEEIRWRQESLDSIYNSRLYRYLCKHIWKVHNEIKGLSRGAEKKRGRR